MVMPVSSCLAVPVSSPSPTASQEVGQAFAEVSLTRYSNCDAVSVE